MGIIQKYYASDYGVQSIYRIIHPLYPTRIIDFTEDIW